MWSNSLSCIWLKPEKKGVKQSNYLSKYEIIILKEFMKSIKPQTQEAWQTTGKINLEKKSPRHIIIQVLRIREKCENGRVGTDYIGRSLTDNTDWLHIRNNGTRGHWNKIFKMWGKNSASIYYSSNKKEENTFFFFLGRKEKLRLFVCSILAI